MSVKGFYAKGTDRQCLKVLLFLLPFGIATLRHYGSVVFLLISLFAVTGVCLDRDNFKVQFSKNKYIYFSIIILLVAVSFSFINASDYHGALKKLKRLSYLIIIIPLSIRLYKDNYAKPFLRGLVLSSFFSLAIAIYAVTFGGETRAQGFYHPIIFGDIMAFFGALLFLDLLNNKVDCTYRYLEVFAIFSYLACTILSGSRGAIFFIPFITFFILILSNRPLRFKVLTFCSFAVLIIAFALSLKVVQPGTFSFVDRVNSTVVNLHKYFDGENKNSSLGQRLMMWGIAVDVFKDHPLVGTGLDDFKYEIKTRIKNKQTDLNHIWPHAHSIYFNFLSSAGTLGILSLMLIFVSPIIHWKGRNLHLDPSFLFVTIFSFMLFGLTEDWFSRSVLVIAFVVGYSLFLSVSRLASEPFH